MGQSLLFFDGVDKSRLEAFGDVRTPGIADVFVAMMEAQGAAR